MPGHFQEFEDQYLETMYKFYEENGENSNVRVRTGDLAERLRVSPASATEMIQRLSAKGYIDYERYKGAKLTVEGLKHGQMIKRRHRLAEVLLERIPFEGNTHETACRLEHAIDDDLEVALTLLLGNPQTAPVDGAHEMSRDIPDIGEGLSQRVVDKLNKHKSIHEMSTNESGEIVGLLITQELRDLFQGHLSIGASVESNGNMSYVINKQTMDIKADVARLIIVEV
ncbi:MAG TPA: metal-dependent transcriptional regulator [Candidatus Poseidoniales archaeon]|nr:MAG TPA: metal-dependent transcriptional regulator [Candidatus Poseidoniales archaeon]|tara:strand:- start:4799 stop:5479 length:681 start_codon:yes stop_codon:yes gene_type:complete